MYISAEFEQGSDPVKGDKARDVRKLIQYGKQKGVIKIKKIM